MSNKRTVVITGAAKGLGRAMAERFNRANYNLVLLDMNPEVFSEWVPEIAPDALCLKCNITNRSELENACKAALQRFGNIDVLVNNAGIGKPVTKFEDILFEDWKQVIDVNLNGTFLCTQVFGKEMLDKGGSIINIASQAANMPSALKGAYSPSKAAVVMMGKLLALEWGPRKVRVNSVLPGIIKSEMAARLPGYNEQARADIIPSGRVGLPEDVANAVLFLAGDESSFINGEELFVDGGFTKSALMQMTRLYNTK